MALSIRSSPHTTSVNNTGKIMRQVCLATLPALAISCYFFGWGLVINLVIAVSVAVILEATILYIRKYPIKLFLTDYSAVVTAVLLALSLPPYAPWWLVALGSSIAIILGKHVYGGLGQNPFNPAMVAYAVLLVSRPVEMSQWANGLGQHLTFVQTLSYKFIHYSTWSVDAYSMATPLDLIKHPELVKLSGLSSVMLSENLHAWQLLSLGYLVGGLYLWYRKTITWHIPLSVILSVSILSSVFYVLDPSVYASPLLHLSVGSVIFCAFFIATDPVSAPVSNQGRLIYGCLIGGLIFIMRSFGSAYPDAVAFAILLANFTVASIDIFTKPRVYGHKK